MFQFVFNYFLLLYQEKNDFYKSVFFMEWKKSKLEFIFSFRDSTRPFFNQKIKIVLQCFTQKKSTLYRSWTCDHQLRRLLLYPTELRVHRKLRLGQEKYITRTKKFFTKNLCPYFLKYLFFKMIKFILHSIFCFLILYTLNNTL